MKSQIEELKNQISKIQQNHSNDLGKLKQKLSELEQSQAKPLKGLIKDPKYRGDCFFAFAHGVVHQPTLTGIYVFALNQGRAFYDKESAERFAEHEQLQYELSCATESATGLYFLVWNTKQNKFFIDYYFDFNVRFGFKRINDAEKFASNYTPDQIKLMLGVGL